MQKRTPLQADASEFQSAELGTRISQRRIGGPGFHGRVRISHLNWGYRICNTSCIYLQFILWRLTTQVESLGFKLFYEHYPRHHDVAEHGFSFYIGFIFPETIPPSRKCTKTRTRLQWSIFVLIWSPRRPSSWSRHHFTADPPKPRLH